MKSTVCMDCNPSWEAGSHSYDHVISKFLIFCGTRRFISVLIKTLYRFPSWTGWIPVNISVPYILKNSFNIILLSVHKSFELSVYFRFANQNFVLNCFGPEDVGNISLGNCGMYLHDYTALQLRYKIHFLWFSSGATDGNQCDILRQAAVPFFAAFFNPSFLAAFT